MDLPESLDNILGRNCEKICYIPVYHSLTFLTGDDMSVTNHFERLKESVHKQVRFPKRMDEYQISKGLRNSYFLFLIATLRFNGATTARSSKKKTTTTTQKTTKKRFEKDAFNMLQDLSSQF